MCNTERLIANGGHHGNARSVQEDRDHESGDTDADMIHFEILASNLLRDASNPSYPARLNPTYKAVVGNIKNIPALESWLSALSFENPNNSITTGLMYDREQRESILEKIVNGTL